MKIYLVIEEDYYLDIWLEKWMSWTRKLGKSPSLMFSALLMLAISGQFYGRKKSILSLTTSKTKFRQTKMGKVISAQQRKHWRTQDWPWNSEICCNIPYNWSTPVTGWRTLWKIVLQPWGQNEKTSIFLKNVLPGFWTE